MFWLIIISFILLFSFLAIKQMRQTGGQMVFPQDESDLSSDFDDLPYESDFDDLPYESDFDDLLYESDVFPYFEETGLYSEYEEQRLDFIDFYLEEEKKKQAEEDEFFARMQERWQSNHDK